MIRNNQTYYYHADGLGSIIAITNSAGQVVQRYEYDSFGQITYIQDPNFIQPYTYTGREYDEESGLYYYRARYYDAKVGRFISEDPIGFAGGDVNFYAYVGNNPVNFTDPSGEAAIAAPIIVGLIRVGAWLGTRLGPTIFFFPLEPPAPPIDDLRRQLEEAKCFKAYAECVKSCIKCPGEGGSDAMECIRNKCVPEYDRCMARIK